MPLYCLHVNDYEFNDLFAKSYEMLSFDIKISLEASSLEDAYKKVRQLLYDAGFRHGVSGQLHRG